MKTRMTNKNSGLVKKKLLGFAFAGYQYACSGWQLELSGRQL